MIADMESNKKLGPIVTKMFLRRMLNILLVFISQSYLKYPKEQYSFLVNDTTLSSDIMR